MTKQHIKIDEANHVEEPFLKQLEAMSAQAISSELKWEVVRLDRSQHPNDTGRKDFAEVVIYDDLYYALERINPWLEQSQIREAIDDIKAISETDLVADNQKVLDLLLKGTHKYNEKSGTDEVVRYIDFETEENNSFVAVSQLKIRIPGTDSHIFPDIVCFVNGLPLVVVECKSPKVREPLAEAIDQMMRYSEQRGEEKEGSKALFAYNQILIATCRNKAKFGTITTNSEKHFYRWTDPFPHTIDQLIDYNTEQKGYFVNQYGEEDVQPELRTLPNDQQRLVHGMLLPHNLLSILKSFTIFTTNDKGDTIKIVGRYQQFRAVQKAVERIKTGKNPKNRGGIIWHTQGSGKSLTMVFFVRELWSYNELMDYKVVLVTDRTQLDNQLTETAQNIGYSIVHPDKIDLVKSTLKDGSYNIASIMIQKFQDKDLEDVFPTLNKSDRIIVLTDEAHRSQYKLLRANLDKAVPKATHIGFTGTPIDKTEDTFGDYIDKYTMRQAIDDGVTLEIVYEGKTTKTAITDRAAADKAFLDVFVDEDAANLTKILGYGSRRAYLETQSVIERKAKDMLNHYLTEVFPNGFKAQIVAVSKEAAHRYKLVIDAAIKDAVSNAKYNDLPDECISALSKLKAEVVVSSEHNEDSHLKIYNDKRKQESDIASFKIAFNSEKDGVSGDVGILIVVDMLTTGFDAPIEQVMYVDKVMVMHNLLQAVARVNRVGGKGKDVGYIVDYVGIGHHLKEALDSYHEREQKEVLSCLTDINDLANSVEAANNDLDEFFKKHKITDFTDYDAVFNLFYDDDIRMLFMEKFRAFSKAINNLYPRKEALDYIQAFNKYSEINVQAALHTRDESISLKDVPRKIRVITDQYLAAKGIKTIIEPIAISDNGFMENVERKKSNKTKSAEIEHAIRHFININVNEDPELFQSFSDALEQILTDFAGRWDVIKEKLAELRAKILERDKEPTYGLDRKTQMPYFRALKNNIYGIDHTLMEDEISRLVSVTKEIYDKIHLESSAIGFWGNETSQIVLRSELIGIILSEDHMLYKTTPSIFPNRNAIVTRLLEIAKPK